MKTAKKLVLAALMVAVMAFALCACGSQNADGTYVIESLNGQSVQTVIDSYKEMGLGDMTAEQLTKLVISGENCTLSAYQSDDKTGTVKVDGEKITITIDGKDEVGTLKDGTLTITESGISMVMKKK